MDVAALTAFLAPALSFLLQVGDDVAERARQSLGEATWKYATRIWSRMSGKVEADAEAMTAAKRLAQAPDDVDAREKLTSALEPILDKDAKLGEALRLELDEATIAIASAPRSVAIAEGKDNVVLTGNITFQSPGDVDKLPGLGGRARDPDR